MLLEPTQVLTHLRGNGTPSASDWPEFVPTSRPAAALRNVAIHYVLMEMPMRDALAILPPALHPSMPAHLSVTFHRVAESPAGAFQFAVVGVGCRAGIRPRMLTTAAFASTEAGADFLRTHGKFPVRLAEVTVRDAYHGMDSMVSVDGATVLDMSTFTPEPVLGGGAAVKFCPPLNPVTHRGRKALVQVDIGFEYHETGRGKAMIRKFDPTLIGPTATIPTFSICGVRCIADMEFHRDRSIYDVEVQSEEGGMTILQEEAA